MTFSDVFRKVIILVKRRTRIILIIDKMFNSSTETKEFVPVLVDEAAFKGSYDEDAAALAPKIR